jgi:rRNA-processing protein EBP2
LLFATSSPDTYYAFNSLFKEHMAKIKDRLIFETKKIEAVQRRKSNKEQTAMAKERRAHRLAEKAKQKKDHMKDVQEWKRDAERGRGGLGGRVVDVEEEEERLRGVGKKRAAADKRYGFGGKKGRFKQNDAKTLNDMSGFKPRGGFVGGQKTSAAGGKKKNKRAGKRARDAARSGKS